MKLSICVITMNRSGQLKEALKSCLDCALPKETEFVIIDNASTDDTEQMVKETLGDCGYPFYYEKMAENLGVGGGRNYAYSKASGEYAYILDDDAVIDRKDGGKFFARAIEIMDENKDVVTLTTQIYDTAWGKNRLGDGGVRICDGVYKIFMLCGTSHFLRKSFYAEAPYIPNKYGYEEIPPSLRAANAGKHNALCPEIGIIHMPMINKWDWDDSKNHALLVKEISLLFAIKKMMYPVAALPLLWLAKKKRMKLYMKGVSNAKEEVNTTISNFCREYPLKDKIKISTLIRLFKDFKWSIF